MATCTIDYQLIRNYAIMGTSTIRLCSIKSSIPSLYPLHHSHDKLFQALYRFSVLQVTESWAGPGNEAIAGVSLQLQTFPLMKTEAFSGNSKDFSDFRFVTETSFQWVSPISPTPILPTKHQIVPFRLLSQK